MAANNAVDDAPRPISLVNMVIRSVDTLRQTELSQRVPPTWNDHPPLLQGPRNTAETPQLLKGLLRKGIPPALRCAVWLSNIMQAVHPHEDAAYWHEYRTLAKLRALENAYELLLTQIVSLGATSSPSSSAKAQPNGNSSIHHDSIQEATAAFWNTAVAPTYGVKNSSLSFSEPETAPTNSNRTCSTNPKSESSMLVIPGTTPEGALAHKRVLVALDRILSGGAGCYYAPLIPSLTALLLTAQSESYAFCAVREMSHQTAGYFPVGWTEDAAWRKAFIDVLTKLHPHAAEYLDDRGVLDDLSPIFQDFFIGVLPLEYCLRILDLYTLEGGKVLYRVGVAMLVMFKKESAEQLLTISNAQEWWDYFRQWTHRPDRFAFEMVIRKAYGMHGGRGDGAGGVLRRPLRFPRRTILQRIIRMEEARLQKEQMASGEMLADVPIAQPLGLIYPVDAGPRDGPGETAFPMLAVSREARLILAEWMPLTLRYTNLDLLYSTNHHGRSLDMFYNRVKHAKHTIILCEVLSIEKEDTSLSAATLPVVVGMYASQAWRCSAKVYGDGACFLFQLQPNAQAWKWTPEPLRASSRIRDNLLDGLDEALIDDRRSNNTTALLEQFMVSTNKFISMGGNPDGSSGLRLNDDLTKGESSRALGFGNDPLHGVGHGSVFEIGLVEVYGLTRQIDGKAL